MRFSENFSQRLRITNQTFRWLFYIHIYVKLPNVFQLLLTTTKLCHIKASSFGEFLHFTRKKTKNRNISATVWPISTKIGIIMQNGSLKCTDRWNYFLFKSKMADNWCTQEAHSASLKYCNFSIFKMVAIHHLGFFKFRFLTDTHFRYIFYIITPNFMEIGHTTAQVS